MASVKIVHYKYKVYNNGLSPIMLRLTINRKRSYLALGYVCKSDDWDKSKGRLRRSFKDYKQKNQVLRTFENRAETILDRFNKENKIVTFQNFKNEFLNLNKEITVFDFIKQLVNDLEAKDKVSTAIIYRQSYNKLKKICSKDNLMFVDIDYKFLVEYETFLFEHGCSGGGISFYMRNLKAIINEAIRQGFHKRELYPFSTQFNKNGYSLSHLKSKANPRALSIVDMDQIKNFPINKHPELAKYIYYFLFSYYTRGMNFNDMAKLKWSDIYNHRITYIRSKTSKRISVKASDNINNILNQYRNIDQEYVFPILSDFHQTEKQKKDRIKKCLKQYNKGLKEIAKILNINVPLTSYVARHTYATTLKAKGVDIAIISEGLGHADMSTTKAYLKQFETSVIDDADEVL